MSPSSNVSSYDDPQTLENVAFLTQPLSTHHKIESPQDYPGEQYSAVQEWGRGCELCFATKTLSYVLLAGGDFDENCSRVKWPNGG